ncbi:MAG: formylglycine-generating enzyme family protein, partial [bacterium]
VEMELVRVPEGEFMMGSDKQKDPEAYDNELPQHKVYLAEYLIGKSSVTVAQFAAFIKASGYKTTAEKEGSGHDWQHPRGAGSDVVHKAAHPVTFVNWDDALAFCAWVSEVTGRELRLPSEAEWEKAARGTDGRIFPWGKQKADATLCNFNLNVKDTTPVGQYSPQGDSPYGCADMAGNVWEWTNSLFKGYPNQIGDGREEGGSRDVRVLRGGSFFSLSNLRNLRCASRYYTYPRNFDFGFRVCASPISKF